MHDILIRGINKPESCGRCPFRDFGDDVFYDCVINKKLGTECTINSVKYYYSNCPLVELPAHGDLIDRDAVQFSDSLFAEPVIVPASEEATNDPKT